MANKYLNERLMTGQQEGNFQIETLPGKLAFCLVWLACPCLESWELL
jgi:hypothetical protein